MRKAKVGEVARVMAEKGFGIGDVAERAGISRNWFSLVKKGRVACSVPVARSIATVLGAPVDTLFEADAPAAVEA